MKKISKLKERYDWEENKNLLSKKGGIATYFSKDRELQRDVCLKFYTIQDKLELLNATKLAKEAIMVYHPNLCSYYDVLELNHEEVKISNEKNFVLISEFIDGGTITEFCSLYKDPKIFQKLITHILLGLAYLHQNKGFHPELKPSNILVKKLFQNPTAKLTDYVFIPSTTLPDSAEKNKEEVSYMAPEVLRKDPTIDFQKANIWSFGVILHELVTDFNTFLKRGFDKNAVIANILNNEPELYLVTNLKMRKVIAQCLKKNPAERYSDIASLSKAVEDAFIENQVPNNEVASVSLTHSSSEKDNTLTTPILAEEIAQKGEPEVAFKNKKKRVEKSNQKKDSLTANHNRSNVYLEKKNNYSWGLYAITISAIFLGFLSVIAYSEYYKQKELFENRQIIVRHRQVYKDKSTTIPSAIKALPDKQNVNPLADPLPKAADSELSANVAKTTPPLPSQEPDATPQANVSQLPNLNLKEGEIKTINLNGSYQNEDAVLKAISKNIEIKTIGKQLYLLKPLSGGVATVAVIDKSNGETIDSKTYTISGRPEVLAVIGNDLSNTTASSITVLSKLGLKALSNIDTYDISSFTLKTTVNGEQIEESTKGFLFNEKMKAIIKNAKPNQRITFQNIKAKSSTGEEILLKEVYVSISQN